MFHTVLHVQHCLSSHCPICLQSKHTVPSHIAVYNKIHIPNLQAAPQTPLCVIIVHCLASLKQRTNISYREDYSDRCCVSDIS